MQWESTARRQHGVISHSQLRSHGLSDHAIARLQRNGQLDRHCPSAYVVSAAPVTLEARLWSAVLSTGGVLGYRTAARVWGMVSAEPARIDVIVAVHPGRRRLPEIRVHRTQLLDGDHATLHGLPITSRACSALDHLSRLASGPSLRFADRSLQQGWLTPRDFEHRLKMQPGRTGNTRLREVLAATGDGAAAESERLLHSILRRGGVTGWAANYEVELNGSTYFLDVAIPQLKLALEVDGMAFHVDSERFQHDRTRQNRLITGGWTVLRFTWLDLTNRPDYVLTTVRRAILALS